MSATPCSVVIPNWNGLRYLKPCLDSLTRQTYADVEIIVVDNGSTDGSVAYLESEWPQVKLMALSENRGFTGACNIGMAAAKGEIIALLNNDTEVDAGWLSAIVDAFAEHRDAGMIASKMLLHDRRDHFHNCGDSFGIDGRARNRGVWQKDCGQYDRREYVFGACGGAAAYRKSMLDDIGLLDDDFFFLLEDVDLAWRAQLAGYRALYLPDAVVYHHLSASGGGATASYYDGRNSIWLLAKNMPASLLRRYARHIIWERLRLWLAAARGWRGKEARAYLRGVMAGLLGIGGALRKRRRIQAQRRVDDATIDAMLSR